MRKKTRMLWYENPPHSSIRLLCPVGCIVTHMRAFVQAVAAAMAAEAKETAWRLLVPWLIGQWDQYGEDWSALLGPQVDGGLRLLICALLRDGQTALAGTADAAAFNALILGHGGTIGSVLEDLVCAEGVGGSVAYAGTEQIELALAAIVERGGRVNARSVDVALRSVPEPIQVKLHRAEQISVRVWNLLQDDSLRVYAVEERCVCLPMTFAFVR
eukprot:COSAG06_NODE_3993_length_4678_cov_288.122734_3_plen_215_part_00